VDCEAAAWYAVGADGARWSAADDCALRREGCLEGKADGGGFFVNVARRRFAVIELSVLVSEFMF